MHSLPIFILAAAVTSASAADVTIRSGGKLIVKSQITASGSGVRVESGGEFQLNGVANSAVEVDAGGLLHVSSGTEVASVPLNGGLTLNGTLRMRVGESGGSTVCDHISGITSFTMGGIVDLQHLVVGGTLAAGESLDLWDSAATTGTVPQITGITLTNGLFYHSNELQTQGTLKVGITPETYQKWLDAYAPGTSTSDFNNDGTANFMEFALGINPQGGGNTLPDHEVEQNASGTELALIVHLPIPSPPNVIYTVEASDNLDDTGWETIARRTGNGDWSGTATITTTAAVDGIQTFRIKDVVTPGSAPTKKFTRLRVE